MWESRPKGEDDIKVGHKNMSVLASTFVDSAGYSNAARAVDGEVSETRRKVTFLT